MRWVEPAGSGLLDAGAAMQVGFDLEPGPAGEPRTIDLQVLHDPLHVVPCLGERDLLDPVDRVDLGIARMHDEPTGNSSVSTAQRKTPGSCLPGVLRVFQVFRDQKLR